jgi:hypothetical protein
MKEIFSALIAAVASIVVAFIAAGYFSDSFVESKTEELQSSINSLPSWELLYSHNEHGRKLEGNIEKLIEAVKKGYDIKIINHHSGSIETVVPIELLQINGNVVSAQNTSHVSWWRDKNSNELYFPDKPYKVFMLFDTHGNYQAVRFDVATGVKKEHTKEKSSFIWLGNVPNAPNK